MTAHLKIDGPDESNRLDGMAQGVIHTPADRPEGALKVTGTATYAAEWQLDGVATGVLARATITRGKVVQVDVDAARALPGVLDVITDSRLVRNPAQGMANESPVQEPETVSYFGQPIALVVAETFEQARHAAHALQIRYETEDGAAVSPEQSEDIDLPEGKQVAQGDLDQAMASAAFTVDQTWTTPGHNASAMEPHAAMAEWKDGKLTLHSSNQMLKYNRNEVADALGVDAEKVRVLSPYVGGGFGSKLGIGPEAVAAAIAAEKLGRPVRVVMTRQQVYETVLHRSASRQRIRLAADEDGRLLGLGHDFTVYNNVGEVFSEPVAQATHFTYPAAHREIVHRVATVHRVPTGSVRAPGESIGVTVFENAMDELAEATGIDPLDLRLRNIPDRDPESGKPFSSHMLAEALRDGAARFGWEGRDPKPRARLEGDWYIGTGMAAAVRVNTVMESKARLCLNPDLTAEVETDMTDIGTGTYAILTQIAAELLGLPLSQVTTRLGDTDLPPGAGSGGSWGASSAGTSVYLAGMKLREEIAQKLGIAETDLTLKDGMAIHGNRTTPLSDLLDGPLEVIGHVEGGDAGETVRQATYGSHFAEVAVNRHSGETRVRRMLGSFACGRVLNEKTARSQCLGGMTFGIGMALTEEMLFDPRDGHVANNDLAEYHLAVNADVPQLEVHFVPERDPWANPMQAKGIGELGICGAAAAITNAIWHATGVRVRDYPATLDKILPYLD